VIGAVLDLGYCCDFTDSHFTAMLKVYHALLEKMFEDAGESLIKIQLSQ